MEAFIGTILLWAGTYAPEGWEFCWGQELKISENQALFAVIGMQYGGNGSTSFKLPDLRGRFPIGAGVNQATKKNWQSGKFCDNNMQATFGIKNMPKHMHKINNTVSSSKDETLSMSLDIGIPVNTDNPNTAPTNIPKDNNCTLAAARTIAPQNTIVNAYTTNEPTSNATLKPFTVKKDINIPTPAITVDSTCEDVGSGEAVDVQPASLCLNYIICMEGLFPPRR